MTTATSPMDGVWLPLSDAAAVLGLSTDTLRRQVKKGSVPSRMEEGRYLVHVEQHQVQAAPQAIQVVEQVHPSITAVLEYLRERDRARDQELAQLREDLARARADLVVAQAALPAPNGKLWGPFEWVRQMWAGQTA